MDRKLDKLQRLTELSIEVCALPVLAAKMEAAGEELDREGQPSPYAEIGNRSEEDKARRRARTAQAAETGAEMLQAVQELRDVADRVERLVGQARVLAHTAR